VADAVERAGVGDTSVRPEGVEEDSILNPGDEIVLPSGSPAMLAATCEAALTDERHRAMH